MGNNWKIFKKAEKIVLEVLNETDSSIHYF